MTSFLKCLHEAEDIMSVFYIGIRTREQSGCLFSRRFPGSTYYSLYFIVRALPYALIWKREARNWVLIMINHGFITNRVITEFCRTSIYWWRNWVLQRIILEQAYLTQLRFRQTGIYAHLSYKVERKNVQVENYSTNCSQESSGERMWKKWDMIHNSETLIELSLKCWLNS